MIETTRSQDNAIEALANEHGRVRVSPALGGMPGHVIATIVEDGEEVSRRLTARGTVVEVSRRPYREPTAYAARGGECL